MKKIAIAAGISALFAGAAHAQSSVTLYGVVDAGIAYVNNVAGKAQVALDDGSTAGNYSSRWGIRGTEDLGGGLKAIFDLENGFTINNGALGQGGDLFGRNAYVGLASNQYGQVTLGRQADTTVEFVSPLTYEGTWTNVPVQPADYDNLNFTHRINNSIKYLSPTYGGFKFGGLYSFGGQPGSITQNQLWSAGFTYSYSAFAFAAGVLNARDPNYSLYGTNGGTSTTTGNNINGGTASSDTIISGFASASTQQTVSAAATYTLGPAVLGLLYTNTRLSGLGSVEDAALNPEHFSGSTTINTISGSVRYQLTPAFRVGGSFDYTYGGSVDGKPGAKYEQGNLSAGYSLSKRTEVYLLGAYQHASGTNSLGDPATAQIGYFSASSTSNQVILTTGITHRF